MSEATTPQPTPLEELITSTRAFYTRVRDGAQAKQPLTNAILANFVLNTMLPVIEATRTEYNDGFDVVQGMLDTDTDDDDDGDEGSEELVLLGKNLVGKLAVFNTIVLKHANLLDDSGALVASTPAEIREMYEQLVVEIGAFDQATQEAEGDDDDDDGDDEGGEA